MQVHERVAASDIGLYNGDVKVTRVTGLATPFTFCFKESIVAPSFLTEGGKSKWAGVKLWLNILLHVFATLFVCVANGAFFVNSPSTNVLRAMASNAIAFQIVAVLGTLVSTALVFRAGTYPLINAFGIACFLSAIVANLLAYVMHFIAQDASESIAGEVNRAPTVEETNVRFLHMFEHVFHNTDFLFYLCVFHSTRSACSSSCGRSARYSPTPLRSPSSAKWTRRSEGRGPHPMHAANKHMRR